MGGKIAIGIRRPSADFETITAWTNPLPRLVKARAFLEGDYAPFEEYIDFYREDRANQGYGPTGHVPAEYGYVLFDFVDKVIASAQHYTTIDRISRAEIQSSSGERRADIGKIVGLITHRIGADEDIPVGPFTSADIPAICAYSDGEGMFASYRFRLPGWELKVSDGTGELRKIYSILRSFARLSAADHEEWARRLRGRF